MTSKADSPLFAMVHMQPVCSGTASLRWTPRANRWNTHRSDAAACLSGTVVPRLELSFVMNVWSRQVRLSRLITATGRLQDWRKALRLLEGQKNGRLRNSSFSHRVRFGCLLHSKECRPLHLDDAALCPDAEIRGGNRDLQKHHIPRLRGVKKLAASRFLGFCPNSTQQGLQCS